jgi:hypothetical protein
LYGLSYLIDRHTTWSYLSQPQTSGTNLVIFPFYEVELMLA